MGKKRLYFARSMRLYGTILERNCREFLEKAFPRWEIVKKYARRQKSKPGVDPMPPYLAIAASCDCLVLLEREGHLSRGVYRECGTAIERKIPIFVARINNKGDFRLYYVRKIEIVNKNDYITRYAKITQVSYV
jgi:hypothetical protein